MILSEWAIRWGVSAAAIADLQSNVLGLDGDVEPPVGKPRSEAAIQAAVRVQASKLGGRLWRNNVGAGYSEDGTFLRWGLANDSKQVNAVFKSADLIGIRPRLIQPGDVGKLIGQFWSREIKAAGWSFSGTPRETAQMNWANVVNGLGGDASFCTNETQL